MALSTHDGDLRVTGTLTAGSMSVPASSVGDTQVTAAADVAATKLRHLHCVDLAVFDHGTDVTGTTRRGIYRAMSACTVQAFEVYVTVAAGAATTVTVNLLKNGTTMLTGVVTVDSTLTAHTMLAGTLASSALVADDILEVEVILTAGTNEPRGLNCCLEVLARGY